MDPRPTNDGQGWTREQLILALDLYCRIPWGSIRWQNPKVQALAAILERTPSSVSRKLGNFGAFDPELQRRNVRGLTNGSKLDRTIWDEFHANWGTLAEAAESLRSPSQMGARLGVGSLLSSGSELIAPTGPSERTITAKQRLHQSFFRDAVLSSYDYKCCITGLPVREVLVASHIKPWSECIGPDEARRADPTNGLCLSATFDRLFDRHLISVSDDYRLIVSPRLTDLARKDEPTARLLDGPCRNGDPLRHLPSRFLPDRKCLESHRGGMSE